MGLIGAPMILRGTDIYYEIVEWINDGNKHT